ILLQEPEWVLSAAVSGTFPINLSKWPGIDHPAMIPLARRPAGQRGDEMDRAPTGVIGTSCGPAVSPIAAERPIRVCFMIDRLCSAGTENQLLAMIKGFDRRRVRPYLCLLNGEDAVSRSLEPEGCPILRLGIRRLRELSSLRKTWTLFRFIRDH